MISKKRAELRKLANGIPVTAHIGKGGLTDSVFDQINESLLAKELIKIYALESSPVNIRDIAQQMASKFSVDIIQIIGRKAVLYKENPELREKEKGATVKVKKVSSSNLRKNPRKSRKRREDKNSVQGSSIERTHRNFRRDF